MSVQPTLVDKKYYKQKVWQMNAPFYYDVFINFYTPQTIISFEWIDSVQLGNNIIKQKFIYGTPNGTGIGVGSVILPNKNCLIKQTDYYEGMIGYYDIPNNIPKRELESNVSFEGDCNRLKHIQSSPFIIAQQSNALNGKAFIKIINTGDWDIQNVGEQDCEGYGISTNENETNKFYTSSNGGYCYAWDLENVGRVSKVRASASNVNDVDFNRFHSNILCVTDSAEIVLIDERMSGKQSFNGGTVMNGCNFSRLNPELFATGHENGMVKLWDQRFISDALFTLNQHHNISKKENRTNCVNGVQFSPDEPNLLLSSSADKTVNVYNLAKIGKPEELCFCHCAHHGQVVEARWNPYCPGFIGSVAEEYDIHMWKYTEIINK